MMKEIRHVLVGTDFDEGSTAALEAALAMARAFRARLTLVHVVAPPPSAYALYAEGLSWPADEMNVQAERVLAVALEKARAVHPEVAGSLRLGAPWEEIVRAASELDAQLVIVGTHGRKGLSRVLLGSVAEKVVRTSPVPVLTVPLERP